MSTVSGREELAAQDREHLLQTTRRLLAEVQAQSTRIAAVNEIAMAINRSLDVDEILQVVARQAKWVLDFNHLSVCVRERDGELAFLPLFGSEPSCTWLLLNEHDPIAKVFTTGRAHLSLQQTAGTVLAQYGSTIVIALESEQETLGTLNFARLNENAYTQDDVRIGYLLALQVAAAIRNARRYEELIRLNRALDEEKGKTEAMLKREALLNDELMEANRHLQKLDSEKNDFLGIVAHDLKNPLAGIVLNASMLKDYHARMTEDELHKRLAAILGTAGQMQTTITNLLDINALETGMMQLTVENVDLGVLTRALCEEYRERADRKRIALCLGQCPDGVTARADAGALREVLDNLLSNAIKYSQPDTTVTVAMDAGPDGQVVWQVRDQGPGLTEEDKKQLFTKFMKLTARPTGGEDSTGLGLAIVKKLVEAMDGEVWCESEWGQGATFFVRLRGIAAEAAGV